MPDALREALEKQRKKLGMNHLYGLGRKDKEVSTFEDSISGHQPQGSKALTRRLKSSRIYKANGGRKSLSNDMIDRVLKLRRAINEAEILELPEQSLDERRIDEGRSSMNEHHSHECQPVVSTVRPDLSTLGDQWADLRRLVQFAVSTIGDKTKPPPLYVARYLADQSKKLLHVSHHGQNISAWVRDLTLPLISPQAAHMIMSVVLVSLLFQDLELLLDGGWSQVMATVDARVEFGTQTSSRRRTVQTWSQSWQAINRTGDLSAIVTDLRTRVRAAAQLEKELRTGSVLHSIHYCNPGALFNAFWMQAEDDGGLLPSELCGGKAVLMCIFPALLQRDVTHTARAGEDFHQFLAQLEKHSLAPEPVSVLTKAVVWLQK
ncbi:hypothetical protein CC86DRAFT_402567 [Ophiobolus disseminans]|uniref:Uncharacterized protein n=1 Tax=Ophiobolus disseminans TaxID=1469910 RepID=A0A6A7ABA7_9PLEO|nr:hypothetical protein CC86DRAFT_402567 [Ophiobolus disseminans]